MLLVNVDDDVDVKFANILFVFMLLLAWLFIFVWNAFKQSAQWNLRNNSNSLVFSTLLFIFWILNNFDHVSDKYSMDSLNEQDNQLINNNNEKNTQN